MKILKTNSFVSERVKVQPITNAELDAMQEKLKQCVLFVIWANRKEGVDKIKSFEYGREGETKTKCGIPIFVLKDYEILDLMLTTPITPDPYDFNSDMICSIFKITNPTVSEADIRDMISNSKYGNEIYDFLMDEKNAQHFVSDEQLEKEVKRLVKSKC